MPVWPLTSSKPVGHVGREELAQGSAQRDVSRNAGQLLDLRVPALHAVVQIDGQDADVDRFDDVLAEFLQPLVLFDLLLQRTVETAILDGDRDVPDKRDQQFQVVAREEIALVPCG